VMTRKANDVSLYLNSRVFIIERLERP
jgi:hypothetical protein